MSEEDQVIENAEVETPVAEEAQEPAEAPAKPEAAEAEKSEEAATSEEPEEEKPKAGKRGAEKRIAQLVAEREEAKREAEALRLQLEGKGGAPTVDQFEDYEDYLVARAEYQFEQKQRTQAAERQKAVEEELAQQQDAEWNDKVDAAKSQWDDFESVAYNPALPISAEVASIVKQSESGPALAYYLGKNPKIAAELSQMSQVQAAIRLGRIEANLPKPKKVSSAPEPIAPVAGKHEGGETDPSKMSTAQWMEWRRSQLKA